MTKEQKSVGEGKEYERGYADAMLRKAGCCEANDTKLARYEKALRFYAADNTYSCELIWDQPPIDSDKYGDRAREALKDVSNIEQDSKLRNDGN